MRQESPQCTQENPNLMLLVITTIVTFSIVQRPIEKASMNFFMRIIPESRFPLGSSLRESKSQMLGERVFKFIINVLCVSSLYYILLGEDCNFLDVRLGGNMLRPLYFLNHPCQKLPGSLDSFYIIKMAYHCYELGHTIIMDRHRVDFPEYVLHHFLTFTLIFFSYLLNYLPIGAAVMVLHDVTDLIASFFKLMIDVTPFAL
jgi:hypothetical protein